MSQCIPQYIYYLHTPQDTEANPYALRPSTTGHKSWTEGGEASTNSKRTSLNGFDVSSPTSAAIKRRAFALAKIDPYFEVRCSMEEEERSLGWEGRRKEGEFVGFFH